MVKITISKRAAVIIVFAVALSIPGIAGATHIFTDVTDANVHAEGIEWVANAQVTSGCGDGSTYCPNDPVTRAQMGTFMYRLSGNAPGVPPSVNADQLDGLDGSDLAPANAYASVASNGVLIDGGSDGAVSSELLSTGVYEVTFKSDVSQCAHLATPIEGARMLQTIGGPRYGGGTDQVKVHVYDPTGTLTSISAAFALQAVCSQG